MTKSIRNGDLPSVIADNEFNEDGFAVTEKGLMVPAYMASQLGFNVPGKYFLHNFFYPELEERRILPLCPFAACEEYLDFKKISDDEIKVRELKDLWIEFDEAVGKVNYETLMPHSKMLIAILDGGHAVDDGAASEMGFFPVKYEKPVIGIRSDFRLCESIAIPINSAVNYFTKKERHAGSRLFSGNSAYDDALDYLGKLADGMLNRRN